MAALMLAAGMAGIQSVPAWCASDAPTGSVSGLPIPRFVSLKSDRVNARSGPNKDQEVRWVYTHAGMPVEVTAEFENWRRIRDWEGAEGWVYHSLLSGKRTATVVPKLKDELATFEKANVVHQYRPACGPVCLAPQTQWRRCQFSVKALRVCPPGTPLGACKREVTRRVRRAGS